MYERIDLKLQEGICGEWKLSKFTISEKEAQAHLLRCLLNGCTDRALTPGVYWRLTYGGETVMTNTPAEVKDHIRFISKARGRLLIAGLGLGMVLQEVLKNQEVTKVTVVEISQEVIELVGKSYSDPRLEILNADIYTYLPSSEYDYGWYDIWNYISKDNCGQMERIKRRLSSFVKEQDCWCERECLRLIGRQ